MTRNDPSKNQDTWLADLTDQILNGGKDDLPVDGPDPEMRALAGTLVRLKRAFPKKELDPVAVKRMEKQVLKKWDEERNRKPGWLESIQQAWQVPSNRRQFGVAFALIAMAGILILAAPLLFSGNGSVTATAGSDASGSFIWIVLVVLGVCLGWLLRRKP
jgi:hypothetical protein